jgi:hypothetical protein
MNKPTVKMPFQKSGDSALQDAQKAREENRTEVNPSPEQLPEMLQDSVEKAKAEGKSEASVSELQAKMEQLLKIVENLQSGRSVDREEISRLSTQKGMAVPPAARLKCESCRQEKLDLFKRGACNGEHTTIRVIPSMQAFWPDFPGVKVNGVKYAGLCVVPKAMADSILTEMGRWETQWAKRQMDTSRTFKETDFRSTAGSALHVV